MSMNRGMDKEDVVHIYNGTLVIKRTGIGPFAETWGRDSYCSWILLATGAHSHNLLGLRRQRNFPAKLPAWFPLADVLGTEVLYVEADPIPCLLIFRVGLYLSPLYTPPCLPGGVPRTPIWSRGGMNSFGLPSLPWWEIHHQGLGSLSLLAGVLGGVRPYHSVFPFSFGITNQFIFLFPPSRVLLLSLALFPGFIAAVGQEKLGEMNLHPFVQTGSLHLFLNVHDFPTKLWGFRHRDHVLMLCLQYWIQFLTHSMHFLSKC